ncbi:transducin-like enhancer protein 6 isoform X2 [Perognathus longimembris pacificus]|uniref:transducin-like enhancer protein 6 isoform X2 n=1 Tax=Perognathus longimembris pacificus TaxID=214514 RepID=UPI002019D688|nr:transducin-like enhancer protein 6 isoform X2 [Perognathus longimembris pacificus]
MTSEDQSPGGVPIMDTLVLLKASLPRLPEHLMKQLTEHLMTFNHMLKEIHQNIQQHHSQVNNFLQQMEKYNDLLKSQASELQPGLCRAAKEPASPKVSQHLTDMGDPEASAQLHQLQGDEELEPLPSGWQPQFWNDVLTQELWHLFICSCGWKVTDWKARGNTVLGPYDLEWEEEPEEEEEEEEKEEEEEITILGKRVCFKSEFCTCPSISMVTKSILPSPKESPQPPEAQELPGTMRSFLKLPTWDREDFEDAWDRTAVEPWLSKRFAVPHQVEKLRVLRHGESVLSAAVSSFSRHAFTCSKGGIKVWSLVGQVAEDRFPESHLRPGTQAPGTAGSASLRTCLLSADNSTLLAGGHNLAGVKLWDLSAPSLYEKSQLPCPGLSCQALAARVEDNLVLAGFREGTVRLWDLRDHSVVRDISCHPNGARSLVVMNHKVWAGGMDACLRCWDLRVPGELRKFTFDSQIMSLSQSPQGDWVLLGLANGQHWLQPSTEAPAHVVGSKGGTILGVQFSPYGQWWASVSIDDMVTIHAMPTGAKVFQVPEASCINCCAVSSSNRLVVTGSQDHATVYQITY